MIFFFYNCFDFYSYSAQVGSAVIVFIVTWIVLPTNEESMSRLGQRDSYKFRVNKTSKFYLIKRTTLCVWNFVVSLIFSNLIKVCITLVNLGFSFRI